MKALLSVSRAIDACNRAIVGLTTWFILASVLISAANAGVRKVFRMGSNAWVESEWYLFAAAFLLASGYVLLVDEHVRVDAIAQRFPVRLRAWLDLVSLLVVMLPFCVLMIDFGGVYFLRAVAEGERSYMSDGLIVWPVRLFIPLGFCLLGLQVVSEAIKRIGVIRAHDPSSLARGSAPAKGMTWSPGEEVQA